MSQTATTEYEPSSYVKAFLRRERGINAEQTYKNRKTDLKDYELWWRDENDGDILDAEALDIEQFFFDLKDEGYAAKTIKSRYNSLRSFYKYLGEKKKVIEESPFENMNPSDYKRFMKGTEKEKQTHEKITYITPEQVELLSENVGNPRLRNELMIKLAFQIGVREGELVSIRLDDIDRDEHEIKIFADKTQNNRTVYYQPSLDMLFDQWIDGGYRDSLYYASDSPYLFVSQFTPELDSELVNKVVKEAAENAGIQEVMYIDKAEKERSKITSHTVRHGHAVEAIKSGIDIKTLALHLGHMDENGNANIETTERYLRFVNDDVKNSYQNFGTRHD